MIKFRHYVILCRSLHKHLHFLIKCKVKNYQYLPPGGGVVVCGGNVEGGGEGAVPGGGGGGAVGGGNPPSPVGNRSS